jgi:hypothetical protein
VGGFGRVGLLPVFMPAPAQFTALGADGSIMIKAYTKIGCFVCSRGISGSTSLCQQDELPVKAQLRALYLMAAY